MNKVRAILVILFMLAAASAWGQSTTCRFASVPGAAFGSYSDSSPAPTDTSTSVAVTCTRVGGPANVAVTLAIGPSATSGQIATRSMGSGTNLLNYNLFRDSARSAVWGQTAGVDTQSIALNNIPNNSSAGGTFVVYGRIPALQNVAAGTYGDSVSLMLTP